MRRVPLSHALTAATTAAILAGVGVATGAIPGSDGQIRGCFKKNGDLRVVNSASDCKKDETGLSWNQRGASGSPGSPGPPGPPGQNGDAGSSGAFKGYVATPMTRFNDMPGGVSRPAPRISVAIGHVPGLGDIKATQCVHIVRDDGSEFYEVAAEFTNTTSQPVVLSKADSHGSGFQGHVVQPGQTEGLDAIPGVLDEVIDLLQFHLATDDGSRAAVGSLTLRTTSLSGEAPCKFYVMGTAS